VAQLLHDVLAEVVTDPVGVPPRAIQQPLHPIRGHLTGLFGQPPAVLALNLAQQALQVGQRPAARLHPTEPPTDALVQLDQPVCPHPGLLLGLLDLAARPRRAPRCLRHIAPSLDQKAGNLPQPNCDCRTRQGPEEAPRGRQALRNHVIQQVCPEDELVAAGRLPLRCDILVAVVPRPEDGPWSLVSPFRPPGGWRRPPTSSASPRRPSGLATR